MGSAFAVFAASAAAPTHVGRPRVAPAARVARVKGAPSARPRLRASAAASAAARAGPPQRRGLAATSLTATAGSAAASTAAGRRAGYMTGCARSPRRAAIGRAGWQAFGPQPLQPPPTADELYAAEFTREFQKDADPRMSGYCDDVRRYADEADWEGASRVVEEMWKNQLEPDSWVYSSAIEACVKANVTESIEKANALQDEMRSWGAFPFVERFQLTPPCKWIREMKKTGGNIHNSLNWKGRDPVPKTDYPCWLLPAQDDMAEHIAEHAAELRQAGWKLLTSDREVVARLRSKAALHDLAHSLGLHDLMPNRYTTPSAAVYPCILKPARGTWGKNTHIVYSSEEVLRICRPGKAYEVERQVEQQHEYTANYMEQSGQQQDSDDAWAERHAKMEEAVNNWLAEAEWEDMPSDWVLEELLPGIYEYSTTLLVKDGQILDIACSKYEYAAEVYVWPQLEYFRSEFVSVPEAHQKVFSAMLAGFSGICNFNYKLRPDGSLCFFEVNPRVGGDLIFDVPKKKVRAMFEKLDAMFS